VAEAEASVAARHASAGSKESNVLAFLLLPAALVVGWIGFRRRVRQDR